MARRVTSAQRALPDFILIGAQKCGTSSLYRYLSEHPEVLAASRKEVHFFNRNWRRGLPWYRAHFPRRVELNQAGRRLQTGEATTLYLCDAQVPERIAGCMPDARFIVLLREPVSRAYSHYHHERRKGRESRTFPEAVAAEMRAHVPPADDRSYLSRGLYANQLESWFQVFPRSQFLIMKAEDLFERPADVYGRALEFLGLREFLPRDFPVHNANRYPALDHDLANHLAAYYESSMAALTKMLGSEFDWNT